MLAMLSAALVLLALAAGVVLGAYLALAGTLVMAFGRQFAPPFQVAAAVAAILGFAIFIASSVGIAAQL